MVACFALRQNIKVIRLDVMARGFDVVSSGRDIHDHFSEGLEVFGFLSWSRRLVLPGNVKTITIPAICSVNNSGLLWTINAVRVRKKYLIYASSALKNDLKVNKRVEFVHTRFQAFSDLVALQT